MRTSHQKTVAVKVVLLVIAAGLVASFVAVFIFSWPRVGLLGIIDPNYVALDSVQIGDHSLEFYANYTYDSAVLGFSVEHPSEKRRYFPMYCSVYRGMPPVKLDVFLSGSQEEIWVVSSWTGGEGEPLAYYRVGSDVCLTSFGENTYFDTPTPKSIGGSPEPYPEMDPKTDRKILTVTHDKE